MAHIRLYVRQLLIILLVIVITALMAEIVFRVYDKFNPNLIFSSDSYNRFRGKPFAKDYQFRLNSKGFKDIEHAKDKKQNIFRIIGIGDSFAFGVVPYENNFLTLLQQKLNQKKKQFEVINMGIPGTGVVSYFALLVNEVLPLNPDIVVCCFFVGNDFEDEVKLYPNHQSYLYLFLKYIFEIYPEYKGKVYRSTYQDGMPSIKDKLFLRIEKERSLIFQKNNKDYLRKFNRSFIYLKRMKDVCFLHHIKFLVVIIPDELQVNINLQEKVIKSFEALDKKDFDFELPNKLLRGSLEKLDIIYIDLFSDFFIRSKNKRYYKPNDTHWNIAGNELASNLIFDKIMVFGANDN